ncbi:MAG TPA: phospholipase D-like domain-containing protein [Casimicrobiaceae bacterium]|nr:phospholipase D-like domain-containing protein [Casimicrobiaceae bacterium]
MRVARHSARVCLIVSLCAFASVALASEAAFAPEATYEALFTPGDAIDRRIVALIDVARSDVSMQAFGFTNRRIAQALIAAQRRGVKVMLIADRSQTLETPGSVVPMLARAGVPVWLDGRFSAAHNKVIIIDAETRDATLITGSYNYTIAAQKRNAENALIVRHDVALAQRYRSRFMELRDGAEQVQRSAADRLSFAP